MVLYRFTCPKCRTAHEIYSIYNKKELMKSRDVLFDCKDCKKVIHVKPTYLKQIGENSTLV